MTIHQRATVTRPIVPEKRAGGAAVKRCFVVERSFARPTYSASLDAKSANALAALVPLLGCGEEAAVVGFDRLSRASGLDHRARTLLQNIADEERNHDAMLRSLRAALPRVVEDAAAQQRTRRLHLSLSRGGTVLHLARIAGLDAAVCTILSRLLRPGRALSNDDCVRSVLSHIRSDETRHVLVSRDLALAAPHRQAVRSAAAEARAGLAELLAYGADAFEVLGVDPDRLVRDIGYLPNGLLPQ